MKLNRAVLLLFLLAWGCARDDPLLVEGQQHFHNREYQAAIEVLQRAVQGPSPSPIAYRYLGRCYLQIGQYEQALETARAGLARDAEDPELYDLLGAIEMTRAFAEARYSNTDAALSAFQRAIELDSQRATTHYNLGLVYSYRDSAHLAERAYLAALQVDSTLAPAHKKLGLYYRRQGFLDQALSHLQRAVQYAPEDAEAHFHCGLLHRAQGHYDQAVAALERAAELNPYSPQVHFNLSQLYLRTGSATKAKRPSRARKSSASTTEALARINPCPRSARSLLARPRPATISACISPCKASTTKPSSNIKTPLPSIPN